MSVFSSPLTTITARCQYIGKRKIDFVPSGYLLDMIVGQIFSGLPTAHSPLILVDEMYRLLLLMP